MRRVRAVIVVFAAAACVHRSTPTPDRGTLPAYWYAGGATCDNPPRLRVHAYNDDFFILRQPACTNYEKPFLYLVFGGERVLLLDTGAGKIDVARDVSAVI